MQINAINQAIIQGNWTNEQLDSITMAVKYAREHLSKANIWTMRLGDRVKFVSSRSGRTEVGDVVKVAKKYVTVKVGMTQWRVPANMLEKAA